MSQQRKIARHIERNDEIFETHMLAKDRQTDLVGERNQRPSWALIGNTLSGARRREKQFRKRQENSR